MDLTLAAGEVHVLAGANGAGKTTLLRILCGVIRPDAGHIRVGGQTRRFASPQDARRAGIAAIHQELSLVGPLSVADNLLLDEPGAFGWLRPRARRTRAEAMLAPMSLALDVDTPVERLPLSTRQLLEIARALAHHARVVVMDEPTSALSEREAERLFAEIDTLRARGTAILYISHRMEEIYRLADRITVLRDGRCVASAAPAELDAGALVRAMVGRDVAKSARHSAASGRARVEVRDLRLGDAKLSLRVDRGEVVGVTGRRGSGVASLLSALFERATLRIDGRELTLRDPRRAIAAGVILIHGDRGRSLVAPLGVRDNASLSSLARFGRVWIDRAREAGAVRASLERLGAVYASLDAPVWQLSGGNQQKVALARGLLTAPKLLLLAEPTRGIDVAAKEDVYRLVAELAAGGTAVVLSSSESEELARICDRVLVLSDGRITAELAGDALTREGIVAASLGDA